MYDIIFCFSQQHSTVRYMWYGNQGYGTVPMRSILDRALPDMFAEFAKLLTWPPAARNVPPGGSASGLSHFGGPVLGQSWLARLSVGRRGPRNNFANRPRVTRGSLFNLKHNRGVFDATLTPPANNTFYVVQLPSRRVILYYICNGYFI